MRGRRDVTIDRHRFPVDPWRLIATGTPGSGEIGREETLFALGNGFVGVRSAPFDPSGGHSPGVVVNGFHETWPIVYPENAFGLARTGQTTLHAPDAISMTVSVDGAPLPRPTASTSTLDMRAGSLTREFEFDLGGRLLRLRSQLIVSTASRHVIATRIEMTAIGGPMVIAVDSPIRNRQDERLLAGAVGALDDDPRRGRAFATRVLQPELQRGPGFDEPAGGTLAIGYRTSSSAMTIAVTQRHVVDQGDAMVDTHLSSDGSGAHELHLQVGSGGTVGFTKFVAVRTADDGTSCDTLAASCSADLDAAGGLGWAGLVDAHTAWFDGFWRASDIEIDGDDAVQQAVRWNLFQLAQATADATGHGVAAKGVTACGYDGHYFWDTEVYVIPFLAVTNPTAARGLLDFRVRTLPAARRRAAEMSQRGALFPWRTINGEEASAYYPAGTAQYHINADVAHAIERYLTANDDADFRAGPAAEMLVEIARLFEDLGCYDQADPPGFHLHAVTGPDEYTAVVDDNLYTNLAAQHTLRYAADLVDALGAGDIDALAELERRTGVTTTEVAAWRRAAQAMHIGYDDTLGIHPQDASFLSHEPWDFDAVPPDRHPLLLNFHPLVIYRHQVLKQADVVLAVFLRPEAFTAEQQRRNFEYYDPLTTGDSSLSACVQSVVAAQVGLDALAYDYFEQALYLDLADTHGNTADGVHIASAGGVWAALVHGFAGIRDDGAALRAVPRLPAGWRALRFRMRRRGSTVHVTLDAEGATVAVLDGPPCPVRDGVSVVELAAGSSLRIAR